MSTNLARFKGLPLSMLSATDNSCKLSSINEAIFKRYFDRISLGVTLHILKASSAACIANATSRSSLSGIYEYTSPREGS